MDYPPRDDHQYPEKPWVQHLAERPRSSATSRNSDKLYGSRIDSFNYIRKGAHHIPSYEEYEGDDNYQYAWNRSSKSTRSPTSPTSPASPLSPTSPLSPMSATSSKRFDPKSATQRRPSDTSSYLSGRSLYPPPSKPLPPIPPPSSTRRIVSRESLAGSSIYSSHRSRSSKVPSTSDRESVGSFDRQQPVLYQPSEASTTKTEENSTIELSLERKFEPNKKKDSSIFYLDASPSKIVLAAKHGKNSIKVWSLPDEDSCTILKFAAYTEAQCRSREYMIRSHSILSETSNLIAIATKFGTVVEIWDWSKKKSIQSIDKADRWTATHIGSSDVNQSVLAVYHGDTSCIDLYGLVPVRKSLTKTRIIDLRLADLPFLMQYPELALSPTSPMLVAAAGPRPPKPGRPPPDRETLLVAWDLGDISGLANQPHMIVRPSEHRELETAIPCELATYGSVVVSIWIPATFKITTVITPNGGETYNLSTVPVPYRHVLVWDLTSNSTRTFRIPNTISCISPDCRYVAYCHASANSIGGRGYMAILDVITEQEVWRWPDPDATASQSGPKAGLEQLDFLSKVSDLKFSADGECLFVGDRDGLCCMYNLKA